MQQVATACPPPRWDMRAELSQRTTSRSQRKHTNIVSARVRRLARALADGGASVVAGDVANQGGVNVEEEGSGTAAAAYATAAQQLPLPVSQRAQGRRSPSSRLEGIEVEKQRTRRSRGAQTPARRQCPAAVQRMAEESDAEHEQG